MSYHHKFIKLTRTEEKRLWNEKESALKAGKLHKHKRLKGIWLSSKRLTFDQIAEILEVRYRTVQRWVSGYRKSRGDNLGKDDK